MSDTAPTVGWIGLGKLGLPMAACLARSGAAVIGFDRDAGRLALAADRGITPVGSAAEAASGRTFVFTSLPDDQVLRAVLLGANGLISAMAPGATLLETSTVSPAASAEVVGEAAKAGISYIRLPISGSATLAETGQVSCFASGQKVAFEAAQPLIARFTRAQTWLGEAEEARYAKLAINLMISVSAGMMAEALTLARKGGIGWQAFLDVMAESAVASPFVKYKVGPLAARDFAPTFTARQLVKDLGLILDAAETAEVPVPLTAMLRQSYSAILAAGEGEADFITIVRHVERLAGLGEPA
jgi:3-hydroxyisobutyrate dehydrogenase-like beta-hydroxyacid dehydrogenase